ncbi:MAG: hypothetical protein WCG92_11060, partial [Hyphomicrobiales bacterium]
TPKAVPKIGDVSCCDSTDKQRFFVRSSEPQTKFPNVVSECPTTVSRQVVSIEKLDEQGGFISRDGNTPKNIISRILAVFWT